MPKYLPGQSGNLKGGPRKMIPASALPMITKMLAEGKRERRVALALKMSVPTWIQRKKDQPEVADAVALGQEMLFERIVGNLLSQAKKGNVIAGIYLSKVLLGLRENDDPSESRPQITINLPGAAASVRTYTGRTIEPEPTLPALTTTTAVPRG